TGDFNVGSINTGWFNTGDSNTGIANSGNVNTGALISGDYSNGILWRGEYQGLAGLALEYSIPLLPVVGAEVSGSVGPITGVPHIHIPSIPWGITAVGGVSSIVIPDIPIPSIQLSIAPAIDLGTITVDPITITTPVLTADVFLNSIFGRSGASSPFVVRPSFLPAAYMINPGQQGGQITQIILPNRLGPIVLDATTFTFPGFTIPTESVQVSLPLSLTIPGFTIPGGALIPELPLGLALSNGTPVIDIPAITLFDRIGLDLNLNTSIGPIDIPIAGIGGVPGFGNSTGDPSSGFFNIGGGGSGFWNSGASMSGWLNAMTDPLLGSASGFSNFGTQLSGVLNRGAGLSGVFNPTWVTFDIFWGLQGFDLR
ncbi:pentapeptide repeat-containing protein, partial [Mycobacterium bourgelatii]